MMSADDSRDDMKHAQSHDSDDDSFRNADRETLAEFVGRELARDASAPVWTDERYLEWLREEVRNHRQRDRRTTGEAAVRAGEVFMADAQAKHLKLARRVDALCDREVPRAFAGARIQETLSASRADGVPFLPLGIAAGDGRELWDEPVEQWVSLPDDVPDGRYLALKVVGDSMAPLMHSGDRVLVRLGAEVERETVIVARHPDDGYVCKRVASVGQDRLELASLAPGRVPITIPRRQELIVGTVVMVSCGHRTSSRDG